MKCKWTDDELNSELHRYFGEKKFPKLLDTQAKYVRQLLNGDDCFAVMPTSGGKSLIYQLAGILTPGVTVIISPLIALIQDQVKTLNKRGIPAVCIYNEEDGNGDTESCYDGYGWKNRKRAYTDVVSGKIKFLYVTPERFRNAHFIVLLRRLQVNLLILDEVHCMSIWGHEFRNSYLDILRVIKMFPSRPVIGAFTATATKEVREDIISLLKLKLPKDNFVVSQDTKRGNLKFYRYKLKATVNEAAWVLRNVDPAMWGDKAKVKLSLVKISKWNDCCKPAIDDIANAISNMSKDEIYAIGSIPREQIEWDHKKRILRLILSKHKDDCGIVFCGTLANVDKVYDELKKTYGDVNVVKYTGPMNRSEKRRSFNAFMKGNARIMVATNAFGMGVDKEDIRFVIHYNTPNSVENYYQEAGRAGRDKKEAHCYLLYSWVFDLRASDLYSDNKKFKGFRYLYDDTRCREMRHYIFSKMKPADFIDHYFRKVDFEELWCKYIADLHSEEESHDVIETMRDSVSKLREFDKKMLSEELRLPRCLHVNRTAIAERIRKGIYSAGDVLISGRIDKKRIIDRNFNADKIISALKEKENRAEYRLFYKDANGKFIDYKDLDTSKKLTYFDMMVADAIYTLMLYEKQICAKNIFVMLSGDHFITLSSSKKEIIDNSVRKMMNTYIEIKTHFKSDQGISYGRDWANPIKEVFMPLDETAESNRSGNFTVRKEIISIKVPIEGDVIDDEINPVIKRTKRSVTVIPPLYRLAEDLLQFYTFPISSLSMAGEDWALLNIPGMASDYSDSIKNIESWGWNKNELLDELSCMRPVLNASGKNGMYEQPVHSFENVVLTHFLLRRIDMLPSKGRHNRNNRHPNNKPFFANEIRLFNDEDCEESIFEWLFSGIHNNVGKSIRNRDLVSESKYIKKRRINSLLAEGQGIDAILARMKYMSIIDDYSFTDDKRKIKLHSSGSRVSAKDIRDRFYGVDQINAELKRCLESDLQLPDAIEKALILGRITKWNYSICIGKKEFCFTYLAGRRKINYDECYLSAKEKYESNGQFDPDARYEFTLIDDGKIAKGTGLYEGFEVRGCVKQSL